MLGNSAVWSEFGRSPCDIMERSGGVTHLDGKFYRITPLGDGLFSADVVHEVEHVFARSGIDKLRGGEWGFCKLCGMPMYVCGACGLEHTETVTYAGGHEWFTTPVCKCASGRRLFQLQWRPDLSEDRSRAWVAVWPYTGKWAGPSESPLQARQMALLLPNMGRASAVA